MGTDEWPRIIEKVLAADILVIGSPIWLGEKSSVCTHLIGHLYGNSSLLNEGAAVALLGVVGVFQLAFSAGCTSEGVSPSGGKNEASRRGYGSSAAWPARVIYPPRHRRVLASVGWVDDGWVPGGGGTIMWVLVGVFSLGALMNGASPSKAERLWAPVSLVIAVCCGSSPQASSSATCRPPHGDRLPRRASPYADEFEFGLESDPRWPRETTGHDRWWLCRC
jgi:hypothetical protein